MTSDEERVLRFLALGYRPYEVALLLDISKEELQGHVQSLLTKFQVESSLDLLVAIGSIWHSKSGRIWLSS